MQKSTKVYIFWRKVKFLSNNWSSSAILPTIYPVWYSRVYNIGGNGAGPYDHCCFIFNSNICLHVQGVQENISHLRGPDGGSEDDFHYFIVYNRTMGISSCPCSIVGNMEMVQNGRNGPKMANNWTCSKMIKTCSTYPKNLVKNINHNPSY